MSQKSLIVVESPSKARTIEQYLDGEFEVVACVGHVKDLPSSKLGIDVENDPRSMLDILTIIEASKALVYRSIGEDYPFQTFANTVFEDVQKESGVKIQDMLDDFIEGMEEYFDGIEE